MDAKAAGRTKVGTQWAASSTERDTNGFRISQNCFGVSNDGKLLLSCGHWDATFKVSHVDSGRVLQVRG